MSYILEALKKAQAERQLGNAPTIHAPAPSYAAPRAGQGAQRRYLALGMGLVVVVAAVVLLWPRLAGEPPVRLAAVPPPVVAPAAAPTTAPVTAPPTAPMATPAPAAVVVPAPVPVVQPAPAPAPVAEARPVRTKPAAAPAPVAPPSTPPREATPAPATLAAQPGGEESLRTLQQLPDALQREIPKLAFGGYIYSPTPGESLLLVDKMLRREGEEVAPGLVLERLTPKAAVMNYRGTRYRAPY